MLTLGMLGVDNSRADIVAIDRDEPMHAMSGK